MSVKDLEELSKEVLELCRNSEVCAQVSEKTLEDIHSMIVLDRIIGVDYGEGSSNVDAKPPQIT